MDSFSCFDKEPYCSCGMAFLCYQCLNLTLITNTSRSGIKTRKSEHFPVFGLLQYVLLRPNGCILQKYYFKLFAISVSYIYWSLFKFILSHREIMKNKYVKGCTQLYSQHLKSHHIKLTQNSIIYQPFVPTDNHIILQWLK